MAKLPWIKFYPADWLKDPALRMASRTDRGIWIDLLCFMWEANDRGVLRGRTEDFCEMLHCPEAEWITFLEQTERLRFADVSIDSHGIVTLRNRRMARDENQRKTWAIKKARQRSRHQSHDCPIDISSDVQPDVSPLSPVDVRDQIGKIDPNSVHDPKFRSQDHGSIFLPGSDSSAIPAEDKPLDQNLEISKPEPEPEPKPKKKPPPDLWDDDDAEFVAVLKGQPLWNYEILNRPTWWANLSEIVGGIPPVWLGLEFKAMQNWFITGEGYRQPIKTPRGVLRFISHWVVRARENERKKARWQESPKARA